MSRKELIVSFIHSNYTVKSGGTEKFAADLSKVLQERGFDHLCFFSFIKQKSLTGKDIVGINYNDKFVGVIESKDMPETVRYFLRTKDLVLNSFHIQHLKFHNINDVSETLKIGAPVFIFVHDFYLVCSSQHFISSDGSFCGDEQISAKKCGGCEYYAEGVAHRKQINRLLKNIEKRIEAFICPSQYVKNVIDNIFPKYADKVVVRPHLEFDYKNEVRLDPVGGPIRLAFLGRKMMHKGYAQWGKLVDNIPGNYYQLFYMGIDIGKDKNPDSVKEIFVSTTTQGSDAMAKSVAANNIDCAFVWPQCAETYSFVYYELLLSGVYILTNNISGNIADEVRSRRNGKVFDTIDECIEWLSEPDKVLAQINDYRNNEKEIPSQYRINSDIQQCIASEPTVLTGTDRYRFRKLLLSTVMYKIKFSK